MPRWLIIRRLGASAVAAVALWTLTGRPEDLADRAVARSAASTGAAAVSVMHLLVELALIMLVPALWRGTRSALWVTAGLLAALATLHLIRADFAFGGAAAGLSLTLLVAHRAFPVGARNRPRAGLTFAGALSWALAYGAVVAGTIDARHHVIRRALHHALSLAIHASLGGSRLGPRWLEIVDALVASGIALSLLSLSSLFRPAPGRDGHSQREHQDARALVARWGEDSLSPFTLRPDKALHFAGEGFLAYRVVGDTAVVSGDPVAPPGAAEGILRSFLEFARERGWRVVVWAASERDLPAYRELGLHAVRAGEEAFVDPATFSLEGRRVRKLRQSVHRMQRRGWLVQARWGRDIGAELEAEIDELEGAWRAGRRRVLGFAMSMGDFKPEVGPDDLYVMGRSPDGELRAMMRFFAHRGRLSLDAMRRVGETPNGLNEAMLARTLELAGESGVSEVSLNYAGLAHLFRAADGGGRVEGVIRRCGRGMLLRLLGGWFQLERLVRFNEKFSPQWRPRYLLCESALGLPLAAVRVLQIEGYLTPPAAGRGSRRRPLRLPRATSAHADASS